MPHPLARRTAQATTVVVPPESLEVTVQSDREVPDACSESDIDSVIWSGDEDCEGSLVSGEEELGELLATAEVPPVCLSAANQRGGFAPVG